MWRQKRIEAVCVRLDRRKAMMEAFETGSSVAADSTGMVSVEPKAGTCTLIMRTARTKVTKGMFDLHRRDSVCFCTI